MYEKTLDPFEQYKDVRYAAKKLCIHPESVKRLIRLGKIPARKVANKWFIHRDVLEQFAEHYIPYPGNRSKVS